MINENVLIKDIKLSFPDVAVIIYNILYYLFLLYTELTPIIAESARIHAKERQMRSEERERDRDSEGETPSPIPGN